MSGLHLYCVVPPGVEPPMDLDGLDGAPIRAEAMGTFSVWVSEHDVRPPPTLACVQRHHDVVRAAAEVATPLPVRFGEWANDRDALLGSLAESRSRIDTGLESVRGGIEYGVHVLETGGPAAPFPADPSGPLPSGPGTAPGRAYMKELVGAHAARQRRANKREAVTEELRGHVGRFIRRERLGTVRSPGLLNAAHLVGKDDERSYRAALLEFESRHVDLEIHVVGPWPPYSFAP